MKATDSFWKLTTAWVWIGVFERVKVSWFGVRRWFELLGGSVVYEFENWELGWFLQ